MRALWTLAVVCLLAATGAQPAHAAELDARRAHAQLVDRQPALPAVATARHHAVVVAVRLATAALQLPLAVLASPPALALRRGHTVDAAPLRAHAPGAAFVPTRSARGPPAC